MGFPSMLARAAGVLAMGAALAATAHASGIGQVKVSKGQVSVERGGQLVPCPVGTRLEATDAIRTGPDGSVGITMSDDSLISAGPNSVLSFDRYEFDSTTHRGKFDATLRKGSLSVISGRISKQGPGSMSVRTPSAILGVRGTEFLVSADD